MKRPHSTSHRSNKTRLPSALATVISVLVIAIALTLTVAGAINLIGQVLVAPNIKAVLITLVLHLGLVLMGPALLLAYVNLMPRERLPRALETARIGAFATRSHANLRHQ